MPGCPLSGRYRGISGHGAPAAGQAVARRRLVGGEGAADCDRSTTNLALAELAFHILGPLLQIVAQSFVSTRT
jgi:hypothetical protein